MTVLPDDKQGFRWTAFLVGALVTAAALLLVFGSRDHSGSGTRIVLSPAPGTDGTDLDTKLANAAAVLRLRIATVDPTATITIENHKLVVQATQNADQLKRLTSPGQLEMRPVLANAAPKDCSTIREATIGELDHSITACSKDGLAAYQLGPARITGAMVRTAVARGNDVTVGLTEFGQKQFTQLTKELAVLKNPQNEVAILVDGVVLSAPEVRAVIFGDTEISGVQQPEELAVTLRYGGLPLAFAISEG